MNILVINEILKVLGKVLTTSESTVKQSKNIPFNF